MKPDPHQPGHLSYRPSIDGLRAIAVLSVLAFHAFPAWMPGGFIGVDVFFVISGFLISGILLSDLQRGHFSIAAFYARRIRRIFPALILILTASLVGGYFILWPGEFRHLAKHAAGGAGFLVNILLSQEGGYFDERAETKPLLHLWSLGVEEQFYIFWPLLLLAGWKLKHHTGAALVFLLAASFGLNIWFASQHWINLDFYSIFSRFWELLGGGALAWLSQANECPPMPRAFGEFCSLSGLAFIVAADFALNNGMPFPGVLALLPVGGALLIIAAGESTFINRKIIASPCLVAIGLISYPLYLWHWPLLSFAQIMSGTTPSREVRIEMVAFAFILAVMTYKFIEQPFRRRLFGQRQIPLLLASMALIVALSAGIFLADGLPIRFADIGDTATILDSDRLIRDWQEKVRTPSCHLQDATATRQAPSCIEDVRPLLLLWGDSHAASLYPGLQALQATHRFGIAQLTQSGCPPLFNLAKLVFRPNCNELNQADLERAAALKPALILLGAAWHHHDYPLQNEEVIERLVASVAIIRARVPEAKIIVVGPAPRWIVPLPALYRRALTFSHRLPERRLAQPLDPDVTALDGLMKQRLQDAGIQYLSIQQQLCNADGCLTRLNDPLSSLSFIDDGHISPTTSVRVVGDLAPEILAALGVE